jgi:hypothetical protein
MGQKLPSSPTGVSRTLTIGANAREKSAIACYPRIPLVFQELESRESIEPQKDGKRNDDIERSADRLGASVGLPVGRDRPDGLLTLSNRQSVGLRNSWRLKRETVEALSPIQQA